MFCSLALFFEVEKQAEFSKWLRHGTKTERRVAICELDMPLRAMAASSSYGIPTQISGLLKTRLNQPASTDSG